MNGQVGFISVNAGDTIEDFLQKSGHIPDFPDFLSQDKLNSTMLNSSL